MPEVSVVVSIHKVAAYLRDCLDSIISQSYTNLEILCIVNDSPDACEDIARSYEKDPRVRVIVQNQIGGLGGARNLGLLHSRGSYILFVDGDDVLSKNYVQILRQGMLSSPSIDIVYTPNIVIFRDTASFSLGENFREILLDKNNIAPKPRGKDLTVQTFEEKIELALQSPWGYSTANKLFRKTFLIREKTLRFPLGKLHEDGMFSLRAWILSGDVYFLSPANPLFYFYRKRPQSITASQKAGFLDAYQTFLETKFFLTTSEELQYSGSSIMPYVHILTLYWIFGISCHELRNGGWLFHPLRFFRSIQMDRALFAPIKMTDFSAEQMSLHKIFCFFREQNPLSSWYWARKIYWIYHRNRHNPARLCKDKISWADLRGI